nr:MAG TPA: hypothetical protein [Bacteriophage sp.]
MPFDNYKSPRGRYRRERDLTISDHIINGCVVYSGYYKGAFKVIKRYVKDSLNTCTFVGNRCF